MIRVLIYNENMHEQIDERIREVYPEGIHGALKKALECDEIEVKTVTLEDVEQGITKETLKNTDVLLWWGHMAHDKVPDEISSLVCEEVLKGMGAIFLHSAHISKPFRQLMGTSCYLSWREDGDRELLWVCEPSHPIARGIDRFVKLDHEETYGEAFDIPRPDELVFIGSYEGGEVFRSGCCYNRGLGRVFYFQPGHESFPTYYNEEIIKIINNAVRWASPVKRIDALECPNVNRPLEG